MSVGYGRATDLRVWLGVALLAIYAVTLLFPPGPVAAGPVQGSLLERLFPGVPLAWVAMRLACLFAGIVVLATVDFRAPPVWLTGASERASDQPPRAFMYGALAIAVLDVAALWWIDRLGRAGQIAYVLGALLPAAVLWAGQRRPMRAAVATSRRAAVAAVAVAGLWCAVCLPLVLHSSRSADLVDTWPAFAWFVDAVRSGANPLVESGQAGALNTYMLFLGLSFLDPSGPLPGLTWVQVVHAAWLGLAAVGVGVLAAALIGAAAAPLASAVLLFSPFTLFMLQSAAPFGVNLVLGAGLLLAVASYHRRRSMAGLAAFAALAGLATMTAYLYLFVAAAGTFVLLALWRRPPRPRWPVLLTAGLVFVAMAAPNVPDVADLARMVDRYVARHGAWALLESVLYGQTSPFVHGTPMNLWSTGAPGPLDVAAGSLLSPFAVPRTPLRACADSLFDPLGALLAAIGMAVCLRSFTSAWGARVLLGLLVLALLPGTVTSAYDRASLIRNILLPIPVALLAALGFDVLRRRMLPRVRAGTAALVATGIVGAGGLVLFGVVAPRVLPAAAVTIAIEAVGESPPAAGAVLLDYGDPEPVEWLHVDLIAAHVPSQSIATRRYKARELGYGAAASLRAPGGGPIAEVLLWSPALERDQLVSKTICSYWPQATLYTLRDRTGLSRALAARPSGADGWRPALPRQRWDVRGCSAE